MQKRRNSIANAMEFPLYWAIEMYIANALSIIIMLHKSLDMVKKRRKI